jgi:nanoRNase/pAp phosphatase (c-di-AMP/oligoRNAs hydrolase)
LGHKHPTGLTVSFAFPLAQKTVLLKFDCLKVGQVGHRHSLAFSSLSGAGFPKIITEKTFWLNNIIICDCSKPPTKPKRLFADFV